MDPRTPRFAAHWTSTQGAVRLFLGVGPTPAQTRANAQRALVRAGFAPARAPVIRVTRIVDRTGWDSPHAA